MREEDYTSIKGSKLVKLLISQNREIRGMAFYELQRRQCPQGWESYTEFKKNYKIFEVIVCPTGPYRPPVYLVLYDYDYWSSFPDQYYSIPDREIFEKDQDKTGLVWKNNIRIATFDSTGGSLEIPCGSDGLYHGVIADFKQFKDRLAEIATLNPEDYEDRAAYTSGPDKDVDGRYHMARKVCALWNEKDPVTRCKIWIAFGLEDYYEIMKNPACKLRMKEELSRIASILSRKQKGDILSFIDFCHRETLDKWKRQSEIWEMVRKIFLT
jgi:hypothetical protein